MEMLAACLLLAASAANPSLPDSAATSSPDSVRAASNRVVKRLEEVEVRASRLADPLSSQTVHRVTRESLRELPVDHLSDALALQAGVVAMGEQLHVRGGRVGDAQMTVEGIPLGEALRGRPMQIPRLALESADLVSGGLDAEYGGALAGVIPLHPVNAPERTQGEVRWDGDLGLKTDYFQPTNYDQFSAVIGTPLGKGLGAVVAADVLADDTWLPQLRPHPNANSWRADNRMLGYLKLAPIGGAPKLALQLFASRIVTLPYDPMWSLDGYTTTCTGFFCSDGPAYSPDPQPGYSPYRAIDHLAITDEHRAAALLSAWRPWRGGRLRGAAGWVASSSLTSVGGRDDESYALDPSRAPIWGIPESPTSDPFYVYAGDEPYFQKSFAETYTLRGDFDASKPNGNRAGAGLGLTYDHVRMRELDTTTPHTGLDSLRAYEAWAPGAFAYAQGRWVHEGMVLNGGLRLEAFTAGPQADLQSFPASGRVQWTLSPRLGVAYPISTRDIMSLSYIRIQQAPGRDFLYDNRSDVSHRQPLGNPALEPATVISYQAAIKHLFEGGRALQASVFFRDLFGQIGVRELDPTLQVSRPQYLNADEGHAEGVEFEWIMPTGTTGSELNVDYTYMHAVGSASLEEGFPFGTVLSPRTAPIDDVPLDWDQRQTVAVSYMWRKAPEWTISWITRVGSGLPWTASPRREPINDPSIINAQRFDWDENSALSVRWGPPFLPTLWHLGLGLEVRNVFDFRADQRATLNGYPNPEINTYYDDYGAFRGETGLGGGAYWDARDPNAPDSWVRVFDPRLGRPPRTVRFGLDMRW
jgi:outer membrane receptor protein involved in Fe transport